MYNVISIYSQMSDSVLFGFDFVIYIYINTTRTSEGHCEFLDILVAQTD